MALIKSSIHTPENFLKAILESIALYNSHARADIANWLYEGYEKAKNNPDKQISKNTIILELLSKWVEVWEDIVVLALMFGETEITKKGKLPFEIYSSYHTQEIARFLYKAKKGLSDRLLSKIYAIKPARQMLMEGAINEKEYPYFKNWIKNKVKKGKATFYNIAREFVKGKRRGKGVIDVNFLISVNFNTKHSFKVIQATKTTQTLWNFQKNDIALIDKVEIKGRKKMLIAGIFKKFSDDEVKLLLERINGWSAVTREIALAHLEYLEDPNWIIPEIRASKSNKLLKEDNIRPGENSSCLCESGLEFKNCCEKFI